MSFYGKLVNGNNETWTTLRAAIFQSKATLKTAGALLLLLFIAVLPSRATLLGYEGFDYAVGVNLAGLNGGAGWNGAWVDVRNVGGVTINSGNLAAGANAPSGYDARSTGNSAVVGNGNRYGRFLDCSANGTFGAHGYIDGNGYVGATGKVLYVSFMQQANVASGEYYEFEFHQANLDDPGRVGGVYGDGNNIYLRTPSSITPLSAINADTNFYVLKIVYNASGSDDVYVYCNPTGATEAANTPTLVELAQGDFSFNGLSISAFFGGAVQKNDQIRLGESWADVVGGPPGFVVQPQGFTAQMGDTNALTALAISDLPINYQWYHGGSPIANATNTSLTLTNIILSSGGSYTVVASNSLGSVTSVVATVSVLSNTNFLLGYEGFNYSVGGNLAGLNGGTGWSNGWVDVYDGGGGTVSTGNLVAGTNVSSGYDARSTGNSSFISNNNRYGRWLDCSPNGIFALFGLLGTNGNIGADGTTIYVSFLQQPSSTSTYYEFEFHRGDLGDNGRIAGIGNDFNSTTVNFRAPDMIQTPVGPGSTNVNFYVVRIDFRPGNDDVYVYRNPTGSSESDNQPALTMLGVADMSFNGISLAAFSNNVTSFSSVTVKHDEIRLGLTWSDVLGGPPVFVLQPTNQSLYVGQTAVFTALAQSELPLNYQWYRGSNALPGMTNASLTLPDLQLSNADLYSVMASNALGVATSSVATLIVQSIGVSIPVQSLTLVPGSNLVVTATYGGTQPVSFQWFQDGTALAGQTNSTLSIGSVDNFDAGQYVLVANNGYGSVTSSVASVCANLGGILAYEGFNYPVGSGGLIGQNGGIGWSGTWANIGGSFGSILSSNLFAGTNGPAGYDSHSAGNATFQPNDSRSGCFLDCSATGNFAAHGYIDADGNIGADGKTIYISFLQQPNGLGKYYEFEFHRGDLGDPGRVAGIGNDVGDNDVHWRSEVPAGGTSTFLDLGPGSTNVNFYVVRIDYQGGNDNVYVYRNPTGTNESANVPVATMLGVGDMSFNGISLGAYDNNLTVAHDEIRVGITWADVVGNNSISQLHFMQRLNGNSWMRLVGAPNNAFNLQGASAVTGPWTNVTQIILPATGSGNVVESNVLNSQRFYRAVANPTLPSVNNVLADFDESTYGTWVTTGTAFGTGPAQGTLPNQNTVSGYLGSGLANSYYGGNSSTGTLTSPQFTITKQYITFLIGGGNYPGQECINLLVNGAVVQTATGSNSDTLLPAQWDVSAYLGQSAVLQIVDAATGSFGYILIDQIVMTDGSFSPLSRDMFLTNNLLNLPVKNGSTTRRVTITVGGIAVRDFNIDLADGTPDWWAFVDVSAFSNQVATVSVSSLASGSTGLSSIVQSNGIVGATNLYQEALRPQAHFSSKRGWLNDANGMVYYQGQYHLYYQHDPFNYNGTDQKFWGHAVSPDMVRWQELPEAIYPHSYGDWVWSGSAVVDTANTGGFKTGTNDVIVASFYSTARGECIAYSNDGGLTFADYTNNPVVVHSGQGRDPHMLWYAPSNYWVMAVYDDAGGNGIQFYTTPDFRHWTFRSKIYNGFAECPDLFQMPVDGNTNNMEWLLCDGSSGYMLGQFDGAVFTPNTSKLPGNSGSGFYASQTFTTMPPGDSRRVRMGWAQISTPNMPFNQMMYFPTELTLQTTSNGVRLCSVPIREIQNLYANQYFWTNLTLNPGFNPLSGIRGTLFDLNAQFAAGSAQTITFTFQGVTVAYNATNQQISCNGDTQSLPPINGIVQLEIIVDRDTIEIFGNNGQLYMPLPANNSSGNSLISLTCTGGSAAFNSLTVNKLKSIWSGAGN
jgi:fructan beta-fructosidase